MLCWQYFCLSYGWYFYVTWLPTYLKEARHLTSPSMALLSIWPLFAGGIGNPVSVVAGVLARAKTSNVVLMPPHLACIGFPGASGFLLYSTRFSDPN